MDSLNKQKNIQKVPDHIRKNHITVSPDDSSSITVKSSPVRSHFTLPNTDRFAGNCRLKFNHSCTTDAAPVNTTLTVTTSKVLAAGSIYFSWKDPYTGETSVSDSVQFSGSTTAITTQIQEMPAFRGTVSVSTQPGSNSSVDYTFGGLYAGLDIPRECFNMYATEDAVTDIITTKKTQGLYAALDTSAWSLLQRIRVNWGSYTLLDTNRFGLYCNIKRMINHNPEELRILGAPEGFERLDRMVNNGRNGRDYHLNLSDMLSLFNHILPTDLTVKHPLQIELYWEDSNRALQCTGSSTGLQSTINDIELQYDVLEEKQEVSREMSVIPYEKVFHDEENIPSSATSLNHKINYSVKSAREHMFVLLKSAKEADPNYLNKQSSFLHSNTNSVQYRLNGRLYPDKAIRCDNGAVEAFHHLLSNKKYGTPSFDLEKYSSFDARDESEPFTNLRDLNALAGPKFVFYYPFVSNKFENHKDSRDKSYLIGGGVDLQKTSGNNSLVLNKSAVGTGYSFEAYLVSDAVLVIDQDSRVRVED